MSRKRRGPGRPKGSPNKEIATVVVQPSACPRCGSTEKRKVPGTDRDVAYAGVTPDGQGHTHVVWKRYRCAGCGQHRVEKTFENRVRNV